MSLSADETIEFTEDRILFASKNKPDKTFLENLRFQYNKYEDMIKVIINDLSYGVSISYKRRFPSGDEKWETIHFTPIKITQGRFNTSSKLKVFSVIVPYKAVAFNPNGDYALIVGPSVIIKYDGKELMQVANNISDTFIDVAFHPSGRYAIIIGFEGTILSYDGIQLGEIAKLGKWLQAVSWKPDGEYAIIVGGNGTSENIWLLNQNMSVKSIAFENLQLFDVEWKPDGSYAIICGFDKVFKLDDKMKIEILFEHGDVSFESVNWSPNGDYTLLTCRTYRSPSDLPSNFILRFENGKFYIDWNGTIGHFNGGVYFNPKDNVALISSGNLGRGEVLVYDGASKRVSETITVDTNTDVNGIAWHPSGDYALIVGDGASIWKLVGREVTEIQKIGGSFNCIAWDCGGLNALITGHYSSGIYSVNWRGFNKIMDRGFIDIVFRPGSDDALALSSDSIYDFDYKSKTFTELARLNTSLLMCADVSPDGSTALIASYDGKVWIYSYKDSKLTNVISFTTKPFRAVAWHPNGSYALLVGDEGIFIYRLRDESLFKISDYSGWDVSFSKDGKIALVTSISGYVIKYENGEIKRIVTPDGQPASSIAIHPYKDYAIIAMRWIGVYKLNLKNLEYVKLHPGPVSGRLWKARFRPDGAYALVVGEEGSVFQVFDEEVKVVPIEIASDIKCTVNFNGSLYETPIKEVVVSGINYIVEIQKTFIDIDKNSRAVFWRWNDNIKDSKRILNITTPSFMSLIWKIQYWVSVSSPYGNASISGWFENDSMISLSITPTLIDCNNGTKRIFIGWFENSNLISSEHYFSTIVNKPRNIIASWKTEYEINAFSERGNTTGLGWYTEGSTAAVSISPTVVERDFFANYVFEGWRLDGSIVSTLPTYSFIVNGPVTLVASWRTEVKPFAIG
ncbi:WD40 repeat domain-containing protein, partial [Candidatus Bathyarchaeota archaeon]|nr:WD40 repeat domain-containing protein [Candidatus Bathyarchaeota archaeon]